jgi:cell wall-associated NlpC family hydrolase
MKLLMISTILKRVLIFGISTLILSGCAASSATKRYNTERKGKKTDSSEEIRFKVEPKKVNVDSLELDDADVDQEPEYIKKSPDTLLIKKLLEKYSYNNSLDLGNDSTNYKEKVIMEIIKYLNTPYKFGGNSWNGIDCSAFTQTIFSNTFSMEIPRSAREQFQIGYEIEDRNNLRFGDLVFFDTRRRVRPGHVGIYIGENLFAHASRKAGVTVSSLDEDYYSNRFMGARRIEGLPLN